MLAWREILEASGTPTVIGDADSGRVLFANAAARELFGLTLDELRDRTGRQLHPPEHRHTIDAISDGIDREGEVHVPQIRISTPSGREVWVEFQIRRVETGPVWVSTYRDITERVDRERHLERLGRLTTLGRLAGGVAHEINNPATYALANLEAIQDSLGQIQMDQSRREDLNELVHDTTEGVRRMVRVARQLKDLASDDARMDDNLCIEGVIDEAAGLTRKLIEQKGRLLVQHQDLGETHGDHRRMVQALVNLLMNASEAIEPGGTVRLEAHQRGDRVRILVIDDGHGMSAQEQARAAEPFFSKRPAGRNSGLGLSVTWRIVTDHGGELLISSRAGRGTTVSVDLPVREQVLDPLLPHQSSGPVVLVVDDEPALLRAAARFLGKHYRVLTAQSAADARHLVDQADLILLDLVMPGMDGMTFFSSLPEEQQDKVLMMSAGALDARGRAFLERRPSIDKPFGPQDLIEAVSSHLDQIRDISY